MQQLQFENSNLAASAVWTVTRWTKEREAILIRMWEASDPTQAIADILGVTVGSVQSKARSLGLSTRASAEWTEEITAKLRGLWGDGATASQIAKQLGKTRNAVIGKVDRLGLEPRTRLPLTPGEREARKAARRAYRTQWQLAARARGWEKRPRKVELVEPWSGSLEIHILDLDRNQCHYTPDPEPPFLFCGQPTVIGSSWCAHCENIVFNRKSSA